MRRGRSHGLTGPVLCAASGVMLAAVMASCGYPPPMPGSPTAPPQAKVPDTVAVAPPSTPVAPTAAAIDSTPSLDALRVLASIPDPLTPEERMAPPAAGALPPRPSGDEADTSGVPVPSPTAPLGSRPRVTAIIDSAATPRADSTRAQDIGGPSVPATAATPDRGDSLASATAPSADPAAATPAVAAPDTVPVTPPAASPPSAAEPDPCWRVQIAAPSTRDAAETKRRAGESLLLLPMVIEVERGLYKVRSATCMDRPAIEALRDRARAAGFDGAFPVRRK